MKRLLWKQIARGSAFHLASAGIRRQHPLALHGHDFAEIFWVRQGQGTHLVNGVQASLAAGDLVMIRPTDEHGFKAGMTGLSIMNLAFPAETLHFLKKRYFHDERGFFGGRVPQPTKRGLTPKQRVWLEQRVAGLSARTQTRLELESFLLDLFRELAAPSTEGFEGHPDWLRRALEAMQEPEHFRLGTREFARLLSFTPEHASRVARKYLGMTPTDAVNQARLRFAARELEISSKKIIEVCLDCGFNNLAHFYKIFQTKFGMTPREYRRRHQAVLHP